MNSKKHMNVEEKKYKIAEELVNTTGEDTQQPDESLDDFKLRLVEAADILSDDQWEGLDSQTTDWLNSAIRSVSESLENGIDPVFPKFTEEVTEEREKDETVVDSSPGKRIRQRHKPVLSRPAKKSKMWNTRILIAKNPNISCTVLEKELEKLGYEVSEQTTVGVLADFRQSLKVLQSLDMLKEKIPEIENND